ncbi:MAG: DEAD/DEAH box helicase family protein [Patescibacteria group bacterium]
MELKKFQQDALAVIERYLSEVAREKKSGNKHASLDAWGMLGKVGYQEKKNGRGDDVPNFVMKIPTGGGKTLLAVKAIDVINNVYKKKRTGLVLWVVPTDSIFRQTVANLRDRSHPYRQHLDMASGRRTIIRVKHRGRIDRFTPFDVEENLIVYVLMLQSAARDVEVRDDLRIFADSSGFDSFFPPDDRLDKHAALLEKFPNLDVFAGGTEARQIKTSLGNALRLLSSVVILDESHRAYSPTAQKTILGFNPSVIVELSATPVSGSNVLVNISGKELNDEQMIKLDLHVFNRTADDWKGVLNASKERRDLLEQEGLKNERKTGVYIRPILLLQAERTGADQRGQGFIHAEDIRDELVRQGILPEQIAVKTSEQDELKAAEDVGGLLSRECPIRYIITKHALQEGWDCPFAYVLGILAYHTEGAERALTQLVGRILRQPYARKTGVAALDESYAYVYHQESHKVLEGIRKGFMEEGLGDLEHHVSAEDDAEGKREAPEPRLYTIRSRFREAARSVILPFFMVRDGRAWRRANYERDVLARIPWKKLPEFQMPRLMLGDAITREEYVATLSDDTEKVIDTQVRFAKDETHGVFDIAYAAEYMSALIPNPWIAYETVDAVFSRLRREYSEETIAKNFFFVLFEMKKALADWIEKLSRSVFADMLNNGDMCLEIVSKGSYTLPTTLELCPAPPLANRYHQPLQRSLFDFVPADSVNGLERQVAYFLEDQNKLYFWYRNIARNDYGLQGWRKDKIYADFIFTVFEKEARKVGKVYVLETKGEHLAGNKDTEYKQSVFELCNRLVKQSKPKEKVGRFLSPENIEYKLVLEDEWRRELQRLF